MKVLKPLRESIIGNNVNSFHHHLKELGMVVQNNERMRELLEEDGVVCLGAHLGATSVVETLIQKGVGKEKINPIVGLEHQIRPHYVILTFLVLYVT